MMPIVSSIRERARRTAAKPAALSTITLASSIVSWLLLGLVWRHPGAGFPLALTELLLASLVLAGTFVLAAAWARSKGRSGAWALLMILGPLAWPILSSLKPSYDVVAGALEGTPGVLFLTVFRASATVLQAAPRLDPRRFPGLLLFQVTEGRGEIAALAFWKQQSDYEASKNVLERDLALGEAVITHFVRASRDPRRRLWQQVTPYVVVVHAAAFLGGLSALEKYSAWLFEPPQVTVQLHEKGATDTVDEEQPINLVYGRNAEAELQLLNHSLTETAEVVDVRYSLNDLPLKSTIPRPAPVKPGERGKDGVQLGKLNEGSYVLAARVRARTGRLRSSRVFPAARKLTVWPRRPTMHLQYSDGSIEDALFVGEIGVGAGAPKGLRCQLTISSPFVRIGTLRLPGITSFPSPSTSRSGTTTIQEFNTPTLAPFRKYQFQVFLRGTANVNWREVDKATTLTCAEVT